MRRTWLWALMIFIFIILMVGVGVSLFAYRRVSTLSDLNAETDQTLRHMYRLVNSTYHMLYDAEDIWEAQTSWKLSYTDAYYYLDKLSFHKGLDILDPGIATGIRQTRNSWDVTTQGFTSGNESLTNFLISGLELEATDNIQGMLDELNIMDLNDEVPEGQTFTVFLLRQAYMQVDSANDQFWYFTTSGLEGLGLNVQEESRKALQLTLALAGGVMFLLLMLIAVVLLVSLRILRLANINLEEQVLERTKAIQNLLDFSGEGFFTFGSDLVVNPELSHECETIFGRSIVGENISETLFTDEQKKADFADALALVFTGTSLPEVVFDVLEPKAEIEDKTIEMNFRLVNDSTIQGQLRDVTVHEKLQRTLEDENTQREMVLRAVTSKRYFVSLLEEAEALFASLEACITEGNYTAADEENERIIRNIHTFKANAAFLRLSRTVKLAHELESALIAFGILSEEEPLGPEILEFKEAFQTEVDTVVGILGEDWLESSEKVEIGIATLEKTRKFVQENYPDDRSLLHAVDVLSYLPLSDLFRRLGEMTEHLASTNGKRVNVEIDCDGIMVTPEQYRGLSDSVNHILRNMITHGIEFPRHREKAGKPGEGVIKMRASLDSDMIEIRVSDDGAGLSTKKITARAMDIGRLKKGECLETRELVKMIFEPGFSTADTVTAVSGRGYGLAAVREMIYGIGGKIRVSTARGRGTGFTILVPDERKAL